MLALGFNQEYSLDNIFIYSHHLPAQKDVSVLQGYLDFYSYLGAKDSSYPQMPVVRLSHF